MKKLVWIVIFLLALGTLWGAKVSAPEKEVPIEAKKVEVVEKASDTNTGFTVEDYQLLALTNQDRQENGLQSLTMSQELDVSAESKCQDMLTKGYWAHDPPGPTTTWDTFPKNYWQVGENLSRYYSVEQAEIAWMNSPTHRANILGFYKEVGFAQCGTLIVAHFGLR